MLSNSSIDGFRQNCSWKTIQSDEKGHFSTWLQEVVRCNPGCLQTFQEMSSEEERVLYCTSLNKVNHFIVKPVYKQKDKEVAMKRREEGNAAFKKKWYKQASMMYSISAVKCPAGEDILAYSIANRSACLYYLGQIDLCMADINLAISLGYPAQLQYKLYERLTKCYILLNDKDNGVKSLLKAKKMLESYKDKLGKDVFKKAMTSILELKNAVANPEGGFKDNIEIVEESEPDVPKVAWKSNRKIREMSNLLKVDYTPEVGRHVKAEKTVKAGDTLMVEDPFAAVLYPEKQGSNCDLCFKKLRSVVPCSQCSGVGYCSVECRDSATYHKYECKHQDLIQGLGGSALAKLALRIITSHPLDYFVKLRTSLNINTEEHEFKQSYVALFNLVGLDEQRWNEDLFARTMMAVALLKILKETKYFPDRSDAETFTDNEIFIGSLILRHLNILQFNAHEVYELLRGDRTKIKPCKNHLIGLAVYPRASYFNHSCHPNTARYNIGKKLVIKSLSVVSAGSEVSDNYGPVYYFKTKEERQKELESRYWFKCSCNACKENWGKLGENTKAVWREGKEDQGQLDFLESLYKCGADYLDHGDRTEAVNNLVESINGIYELVVPPLDTLTRAEDKLRTCCNDMGTVVFNDLAIKYNPAEKSSNPMTR